MKNTFGVGAAVAVLVAVVLLLRPAPSPQNAAVRPAPATSSSTADAPPKAAETASAPGAAAPSPVDSRRLLAALAKALRDSDEKAARAALKDIHDLLYPPIPDEKNAALLYMKAFDIAREKMGGVLMMDLDRQTYSALFSGKELTTDQSAALRAWFEKNGPVASEVIGLLREGAKLPQCRFEIGDPAANAVIRAQGAGQFLRIAAFFEQQNGKTAEAADLTMAELAMARNIRSTPYFIAQAMGCAMDATAVQNLQGFLNPGTPGIAAWLDRSDPASVRDAFLRSLLGDVEYTMTQVFTFRDNPDGIEDEELRKRVQAPLALQDLAAYVEGVQDFSRFAGRPYYEIREDLDTLSRQYGELAPWYATFSQDVARTIPSMSRWIAKSEAMNCMAKLSLDLARYREKNGEYPATLDALLVPSIRDPFTGQPFAYRKEGSGYVLETPGAPDGKTAYAWRANK